MHIGKVHFVRWKPIENDRVLCTAIEEVTTQVPIGTDQHNLSLSIKTRFITLTIALSTCGSHAGKNIFWKGNSMKNRQITSFNGHSEHNERQEKLAHSPEIKHYASSNSEDQIMLDDLMNAGFAQEEAAMLLHFREHLYENAEMRQRLTDDLRMHFVRWLYISGEMNEG